eukprot:gene3148-3354_t
MDYLIVFLILTCFLVSVSALIDPAKPPLHPKQLRELNKKISTLKKRTAPKTSDAPQSQQKSSSRAVKSEKQSSKDNYSTLGGDERIQKVIAHAGLASRRDAERMILDGRVTLNGKKITELGIKMNARQDKLFVDGKLVTIPTPSSIFWIVLNKPKDVLSTLEDDKSRETILNFLPKANDLRLVPVGRMDRSTSGLLLLTNDVGWIHPLTHASYHSSQRFEVTIRGNLKVEAVDALREGKLRHPVTRELLPAIAVYVSEINQRDQTWLLDLIVEDQPAAVIFDVIEAWGCEFLSSRRTEYGPIKLKGLKRGEWKELTPNEIQSLKISCKKKGKELRKSLETKDPSTGNLPLGGGGGEDPRTPSMRRSFLNRRPQNKN